MKTREYSTPRMRRTVKRSKTCGSLSSLEWKSSSLLLFPNNSVPFLLSSTIETFILQFAYCLKYTISSLAWIIVCSWLNIFSQGPRLQKFVARRSPSVYPRISKSPERLLKFARNYSTEMGANFCTFVIFRSQTNNVANIRCSLWNPPGV